MEHNNQTFLHILLYQTASCKQILFFRSSGDEAYTMIRKMEERRMSSLDHHWAVPKQKGSQDSKDGDGEVVTKNKDDSCHLSAAIAEGLDEQEGNENLVKSSCHDSGIDIRDADQPPLPPIIPCTKKVVIQSLLNAVEWRMCSY